MDDIVAHFRLGLVGLVASCWRKPGPSRAGEAFTAVAGFCLSACQRDEEGVGERRRPGLAAPADPAGCADAL
jgi:hypothetical protein